MPVYGGTSESQQRLQRQPNLPLLPNDPEAIIPYLWLLDRAYIDSYGQLAERLQTSIQVRSSTAFGAADTTAAVTLDSPLSDAAFHVIFTSTWNTKLWVSSLATTGFTINASDAPGGAGGTVYWTVTL